VIHPADLDELLEFWRSILASSEPGEMEVRLQRSDGEYRRFLFRASPLVDASGQLVKWCGINIDIQDRRQTEAAMRAPWWTHSAGREDHFRLVAENTADLAALVAPDGQFELANQRASAFFGATIDKLKQWAIVDAVHPDDLPIVRAAWRESLETGRPYDVQERLRRADGVYRWFHTQGMPPAKRQRAHRSLVSRAKGHRRPKAE
jgi:PAS domain S-box-containing protein